MSADGTVDERPRRSAPELINLAQSSGECPGARTTGRPLGLLGLREFWPRAPALAVALDVRRDEPSEGGGSKPEVPGLS